MDKALVILSDNNKGRFISKGFAASFKALSYFVYERKIYDLIPEEITKISPDVIFIFWTDVKQKEELSELTEKFVLPDSKYIHCAEKSDDIPLIYKNKANHYIFAGDSENNDFKFIYSINPEDYKTKFTKYKYNISFAGNPAQKSRETTLLRLIYNFGEINIFCRSYDFYKSVEDIEKSELYNDYLTELYKKSYKGYVETSEELASVYVSSKINIDLKNENKKYNNLRSFESAASGGFIISPYDENTVKSFDSGKDIEIYASDEELIDKIKFYLNNLNLAQLIAVNGKKNCISNHSSYDRLKKMLKVINDKDISG